VINISDKCIHGLFFYHVDDGLLSDEKGYYHKYYCAKCGDFVYKDYDLYCNA